MGLPIQRNSSQIDDNILQNRQTVAPPSLCLVHAHHLNATKVKIKAAFQTMLCMAGNEEFRSIEMDHKNSWRKWTENTMRESEINEEEILANKQQEAKRYITKKLKEFQINKI